MTPTPESGDIWEWTHIDPAVFLLIESSWPSGGWKALNLTTGSVDGVAIHQYNAPHWRKLA